GQHVDVFGEERHQHLQELDRAAGPPGPVAATPGLPRPAGPELQPAPRGRSRRAGLPQGPQSPLLHLGWARTPSTGVKSALRSRYRVNLPSQRSTVEFKFIRAPATPYHTSFSPTEGDGSCGDCQNGRTRTSRTQVTGNCCIAASNSRPAIF